MSSASRTIERNGPKLTGRAAALLVTLGLLVMLALAPVRQYLDQRARIAELEGRTVELERQNADLRATINGLNDPAELERLARECLGMVGPGETALLIPGASEDRATC